MVIGEPIDDKLNSEIDSQFEVSFSVELQLNDLQIEP